MFVGAVAAQVYVVVVVGVVDDVVFVVIAFGDIILTNGIHFSCKRKTHTYIHLP